MSTMKVDNILGSGGGNTAQINGITPALASQAEAQAGTDNAKLMTPLRVAEELAALNIVLLGTIATTSGSSQVLSGLTLTAYKFLRFVANGVSFNGASNLSIDGIACSGATTGTADVVHGIMDLDLSNGVFSSGITRQSVGGGGWSGVTSYRTSSTSVTVGVISGSFDAGSIRVYGVR